MSIGYKKDYEEYYGMRIPNDWEVHHINYNHTDNSLDNLIALPADLHKQLHVTYAKFLQSKLSFKLSDIHLHSGKTNNYSYFMEALADYVNAVETCTPYMNLRDLARLNKCLIKDGESYYEQRF